MPPINQQPVLLYAAVAALFASALLLFTASTQAATHQRSTHSPLAQTEFVPLTDIEQVAAGSSHTCALTSMGGVKCWGQNSFGQLGDGTSTTSSMPVEVSGLSSGVTALAVGGNHNCAIVNEAGVKCWGDNDDGQLGNGTVLKSNVPVEVSDLAGGATVLAAGSSHTCALTSTGDVKCWGSNGDGQLGNGTTVNSSVPVAISGLGSEVMALTAGELHSCALAHTGAVKCWGRNNIGQLGNGTMVSSSTPVDVSGIADEATALAAGQLHTCAILGENGVKCWGRNDNGQLGDGTIASSSVPIEVSGIANGATALTAGLSHTCAVLSGGIKCWGDNRFSQLGDGTTTQSGVPVGTSGLTTGAVSLAAGQLHTCAVLNTGDVKCWGNNYNGQLGDGTTLRSNVPLDVSDLISGLIDLASGDDHTCGLIGGGDVKCWGRNDNGQLGNGMTLDTSAPLEVSDLGGEVTILAAGGAHTCGLLSEGNVKCWGRNDSGQLGNGTMLNSSVPVAVSGLDNGITLAAGQYHTCAILGENGVKCWGRNDGGQLGDGTNVNSSIPVVISSLGGDASAIVAGRHHTCGLLNNGAVKCWGLNVNGQLGDGTNIDSNIPVVVSGLESGVTALAAGRFHTCALLNSGVKCWGRYDTGPLGDGTTWRSNLPVAISGLSSGVTALAAKSNHTCVSLGAGGVKCWGENRDGQLGNGTTLSSGVPVTVSNIDSEVTLLSAGGSHTCALLSGDDAKCWGDNLHGQLGIGRLFQNAIPGQVLVQPINETSTPTTTPTPTPTSTPTPTPTNTPTPTTTPTPTESSGIDSCAEAQEVTANGVMRDFFFDKAGDVNWIRFDARAGVNYRIEVEIPIDSIADVNLELRNDCGSTPIDQWSETFSPGARLDHLSAVDSTLYLRLANYDASIFGQAARYQVSIRDLLEDSSNSATIIVAGRLRVRDRLQNNIHHVTDSVYRMFLEQENYTDENIYYLATDSTLIGYDAAATKESLRAAISEAAKQVSGDGVLNLYMVDHGSPENFYIDEVSRERVNPTELDEWLSEFEDELCDPETCTSPPKINVFIEACQSGSFIDLSGGSISKPNRTIITSSSAQGDAMASRDGAYFSDHLVTELSHGQNVFSSFINAQTIANLAFRLQEAWLDADGDGIPNELNDGNIAAQRGFFYANTLGDNWAPYIFGVQPPIDIAEGSGVIQADVRDNQSVSLVWAVVYPPDYEPTALQGELQSETLDNFILTATGDAEQYEGRFSGFTQKGTYRILVHAEDNDGFIARPTAIEIVVGEKEEIYLPLIVE